MLRAAYIYDLRRLEEAERQAVGGLRVLTTRHWIQGVAAREIDFWLPDAGPTKKLLQAYHDKSISGDEFLTRYNAEQAQAETCRVVRYLEGKGVSDERLPCSPVTFIWQLEDAFGLVTILCWEPVISATGTNF